jgi:hypothetical protein
LATSKIIVAFHDSAGGGYSGIHNTYQRIHKLFYWPSLKQSIEDFIRQCSIFQQVKHENSWHEITMDFIEGLPLSVGAGSILVVVDRPTKYAHFIPLRHPFTAFKLRSCSWIRSSGFMVCHTQFFPTATEFSPAPSGGNVSNWWAPN